MTNLLRADLYVLVRSRALWIALAVSSAMAVAYFVSARLIANGTYDMSISGSVAGFSDAMALPLLGSLLIGVVAASDLENRTVHDRLLAAPRSVHVAVKTVMALALTAVVLLPYVIGSLVCLSAGWDLVPFWRRHRYGSPPTRAGGRSRRRGSWPGSGWGRCRRSWRWPGWASACRSPSCRGARWP